jgi:SNF2-related domain/SNF2 Helicase protein/Helicase conserved C-terminal domain
MAARQWAASLILSGSGDSLAAVPPAALSFAPVDPATSGTAAHRVLAEACRQGVEAVYVPGDPARLGRLVLFGGDGDLGPDSVQLVLPTRSGVRRRTVPARTLTIGEALPALLALDRAAAGPGLAAWAEAATAGVTLISRGRLVPAVSPEGYGTWRAGPLDAADTTLLRRIAATLPPQGHALPVPGTRPVRIRTAESLVRELWDAVADVLARSPATAVTVDAASPAAAFAAGDPQPARQLAPWLTETTQALDAGAQLGLRLECPEGVDFSAVLQLRSTRDPSLVVDAADLWHQPQAVLARLGRQAEADLLIGLRRGARAWPPLAPALRDSAPSAVPLDDAAVTDLLGPGTEALAASGVEVLWPAELVTGGLGLRAVVGTPAPGAVTNAGLSLDQLLDFRWQVTLGGEVLTDAEVAQLAEAKRPLVRLRGRWITVDTDLLERLRRRPRRRPAAAALAAALSGVAEVDGHQVEVVADGPLADLVAATRAAGSDPPALEPPTGLEAVLRPYQRRGLGWLAGMTALGLGGCLADDMGLGKTVQMIALHLHRRPLAAGPTLVVCPASLLGTWEREVARFAPDVPVRRFHGGDRHLDDLRPDEIVLVTYGVVRRDRAELAGATWGLVVADEAQAVKNPLSRTARELRAVPAAARVALTGTPVENRLSDLWAILDWTTPGLLGDLTTFRRQVAVPVERYRDPETTERLARLVRPFLLRRRKTDPGIAPELPPKTETDRVVPLTAEQTTLYEALVRESLDEIRRTDGIARRGLVLKLLTGLKQICNHPAQYLGQTAPVAGRSGKLEALDGLLDVVLDEGDAVLVFTQYVGMARLLESHLTSRGVGTQLLHGGTPVRRREEMVRRFQAGDVPVFLLSLKAAGTGLTLTRATHVVHYDRWWNPAVEDQATDRAYRIGQDRPVQVHRLVTEGTVEDRVAALLAGKRALADAVVGAGEGWIGELSDDDLAGLVSLGSP